MRNPFAAIAVIATLSIFFSSALVPREWTYLLWLLLSRITRRTLGGPAPLLCHTPPSSRIPDTYLVMLANSYSLEQHNQTTGRAVDLERAILGSGYEFNDPLLGNIIIYDVKSDDASLLHAIRADLGVLYVECEGRVSLRTHHVGSVRPTPLDYTESSRPPTQIAFLGADVIDNLAMAEVTILTAAIYRGYRSKVKKGMEGASPVIPSRFEMFYDETKARMIASHCHPR